MIKPFKIINTRQEHDGGTGVFFEVSKVKQISENETQTSSLSSYITVPADEDIDAYLFEQLSKTGWV